MTTLSEIQKEADLLSEGERAELASYLLSSFKKTFLGADNQEAESRDKELDSGQVRAISHDEFVRQVGRT